MSTSLRIVIASVVGIAAFAVLLIVPALDDRFGWPHVPALCATRCTSAT